MAHEWTDDENDARGLFRDAGRRCGASPLHHGTAQPHASDRDRSATRIVEYKHQNISVVLQGLGEDWFNFQTLADPGRGALARSPSRMARSGLPPLPRRRGHHQHARKRASSIPSQALEAISGHPSEFLLHQGDVQLEECKPLIKRYQELMHDLGRVVAYLL
jgi:hypothetical protein